MNLTADIYLAQPWWLLLLLLLPLMWWLQRRRAHRQAPALRLSSLQSINTLKPGWRVRLRPLLPLLRSLCLLLLIVALARPQRVHTHELIDSEGIDIMLSLDVSGSMLAEDLMPNRLEAARRVALDFIDMRPSDRMGLVVFSGESFTQCPITMDHHVLKAQLSQVESGVLVDGTAIGDGLGTAVAGLRQSGGKSRVVILLTDGVSNQGSLSPEDALRAARAYGVRVYTIGVGAEAAPAGQSHGGQMQPVQIDERLLQRVAAGTGGRYYRATDNQSLQDIYAEIDQLEKSRVEVSSFRQVSELFFPLALAAGLCLLLELLLRATVFRSITG